MLSRKFCGMLTASVVSLATALVLASCGAGGGAGAIGGGGGGSNTANFVAAFEGFDSGNRRLRLIMTPTAATLGQVSGAFDNVTSNLSIYDPTLANQPDAIPVSGTFNSLSFSITLASASAPLGTSFSGSFRDSNTIEISGGGVTLVLRRNGYFNPALVGTWNGTSSGQPWLLQFGVANGYDASDSSSQIVGTEFLNGRSSRITGFLTVRHLQLRIERAAGTVTVNGEFPVNGTTVDANALAFSQGNVTRGGTLAAERWLYVRNDHDISTVDLQANRTDLTTLPFTNRVISIAVSPDKTHVAYVEVDGQATNLWVMRLSDRTTRNVTNYSTTVLAGVANQPLWSPDSSRVAYWTRPNNSDPHNLFVVRIDGSAPVPLTNQTVNAVGSIYTQTAWAPAGNTPTIAFVAAEGDPANFSHLYIQRMDGSVKVNVTSGIVGSRQVRDMRWSPDGQRLAFVGNLAISNAYDLYVTNTSGAFVAVVPQLPASRAIDYFEWSGNSNWLAFVATTTADTVPQVRVVARDAINSQVISNFSGGPLTNQTISDIAWAPNSSRLAFGAAIANGAMRLHTASPDGAGFPVLISTTTDLGLSNYTVKWRPDSSQVAYSIWDGTAQSVVSARADGSSRTTLLTDVLSLCTPEIAWSPNGNRVAIVGSIASTQECALFSVNADGTGGHALDPPSHPEAAISWMSWMSDSSRLVFLSNRDKLGQNAFTTSELYMCSADGNASVKLSDDLGNVTRAWDVEQL